MRNGLLFLNAAFVIGHVGIPTAGIRILIITAPTVGREWMGKKMAEYIARKEANEWVAGWLREDRNWHPYSKGKSIPTVEVFDILSRIPAADVQPVVRCKDCKHFHLDYFGEVNGVNIIVAHEICDLWAGGCKTTQDTFCSNGVRKDDGA